MDCKIDESGRIVIPKSIRNHLNIKANDTLLLDVVESFITLKKVDKSFLDEKVINEIKNSFPVGTKVKCIHMIDDKSVPDCTCGTVSLVDDMGSIHVNWSNGSTLALIPGIDIFVKL